MRTFGIIPVKKDSTRFPEKNFYELCGKPLIVNTIEKMLKYIDTIFISTDDPDRVKCIVESNGHKTNGDSDINYKIDPGIYIIKRSKELCKPETPTDDVIYNLIEQLSFFDEDYTIVLCQVTSPNWSSHKLIYALEKHKSYEHKLNKTVISVNPDYKPNGCFYIFTKSKFMKYQYIYTPDLYLVVMDWKESSDIDFMYQLFISEALKKGDYDE